MKDFPINKGMFKNSLSDQEVDISEPLFKITTAKIDRNLAH